MPIRLSPEQVRWFRLRRSGLVDPFDSPEAAASAHVGIQAQILPAAGIALWNRVPGLTWEQVDNLIHEERTLIKLWGQRNTLHLYPSAEWPLVYAAFGHTDAEREQRLEGYGYDVQQYRAALEWMRAALRKRKTLGRSDLRAANLTMEDWYLSGWGGLFRDLVRCGEVCHAGALGNEARFAARDHWLPNLEWNPPTPGEANSEIVRRYLRVYGPATAHDLAYWRGIQVATVRGWLRLLQAEVTEVDVEGQKLLAHRDDLDALQETSPEREAWPVRLLYRFDPILLPHRDKTWIVDREHYTRVWRPAGHIEGTILEHGRVRGTWRYDRKGGGLVVTLNPFAPLPSHVLDAVETHAQGIAAFFGLPLAALNVEEPAATHA
jgi:hypothetical protein